MPKIPSITPKKVIKKFKRLGFVHDHTTGSHYIMYHPVTGKRVVIPLPALLREAGISRQEFLNA